MSKTRRQERKERTRQELLDAAGVAFARRGFHGASMEEIAAVAGFTTGALYWHFAGKDDLFLALFERYATTRVDEFEHLRAHSDGALSDRARAFADQWMERLDSDPDFLILTLEFLVHAWRNPQLREAFGHRAAFGRLALARILSDMAQAEDVLLPLPAEDLAAGLRELGTGLGLARLADPDGVPSELFGDLVQLLFRLIESAPTDQPAPVPLPTARR